MQLRNLSLFIRVHRGSQKVLLVGSLFDRCFFDQHYRDIIDNRIDPPALFALQSFSIRRQMHAFDANGTGENIQQFLTYCHASL